MDSHSVLWVVSWVAKKLSLWLANVAMGGHHSLGPQPHVPAVDDREVVSTPACHCVQVRRWSHRDRELWGTSLLILTPQSPAAERVGWPSPREADGRMGPEHQRAVSAMHPGVAGDTLHGAT